MKKQARMAAIALMLSGTVFAGPTAPPPAQEKVQVEAPTPEKEIKPTLLTPQEMLEQSQMDAGRMQDGLRRVLVLQDGARKQNDVIKLNCVNDKVIQIKAAITIGEQSRGDLQEALTRADEGGRVHAFTKHSIATQKVQVLVTEAENCVGQDLSFVGTTQVTVEVDPNIPRGDPVGIPLPQPAYDRPPEASPFI